MNPFNAPKDSLVHNDILISGQKNLEAFLSNLSRQVLPDRGSSLVHEHTNSRRPFTELERPICQGRQWSDDEVRSDLTLAFDKERDERNRLDRLSKTLL